MTDPFCGRSPDYVSHTEWVDNHFIVHFVDGCWICTPISRIESYEVVE